MTPTSKTPGWYLLTRHWVSLLGVALIVTAAISSLFVGQNEIRGHATNPYVGIVLLAVLPALFFSGLVLVPLGVYLHKRAIREGLARAVFDRKAALRRLAMFLACTTLFNVLLGTQLTYRAVKHMETPEFCGATCHTMKPEFAAYQKSPHSRVECVECHVAPGATGWIASKANGIRQLIETVSNTQPRPIPSALETNRLVPARETCENCHWPDKFIGVRLRVFPKYADDEGNTRSDTVLLMVVGGDKIAGIHGAHFGTGIQIRYGAADPARQVIPVVEYRNTVTGESRTFAGSDPPGSSPNAAANYEMQCIDCHNRPTHTFELPERAMDKTLAGGNVPVTLPFIKKKGVEVLKAGYGSSEEAAAKIPASLVGFYRQNYPDLYARRAQDIGQASKAVLAIYNRNVFPDLKVTWGTYPNNLGHTDFPGCFRCHDGSHTAADGKTISQDCNACHELLATEETAPQILKTLGISGRLSGVEK
jgi:nitrate/TMAO reductase-like tetraheme cytochrome c subunit